MSAGSSESGAGAGGTDDTLMMGVRVSIFALSLYMSLSPSLCVDSRLFILENSPHWASESIYPSVGRSVRSFDRLNSKSLPA